MNWGCAICVFPLGRHLACSSIAAVDSCKDKQFSFDICKPVSKEKHLASKSGFNKLSFAWNVTRTCAKPPESQRQWIPTKPTEYANSPKKWPGKPVFKPDWSAFASRGYEIASNPKRCLLCPPNQNSSPAAKCDLAGFGHGGVAVFGVVYWHHDLCLGVYAVFDRLGFLLLHIG